MGKVSCPDHMSTPPHRGKRSLQAFISPLIITAWLAWLQTGDNIVKILDVRSEEFRRIFRRHSLGAVRDDLDEDLLLSLGDEEAAEAEPAGPAVPAAVSA